MRYFCAVALQSIFCRFSDLIRRLVAEAAFFGCDKLGAESLKKGVLLICDGDVLFDHSGG